MPIVSADLKTAAKGYLTEFQGLLFPPDASVDELNCEIDIDSIRRRRKGLAYESNNVLSSFQSAQNGIVAEADWENVGGTSALQFLVIQAGFTLHFYDKSTEPISSGEKSFTVDLNDFDVGNNKPISQHTFQGDSLDGVFVVAHPSTELFYITYDPDTDTIATTQIDPKIRDFDWQGDIDPYLSNEATPVSTSRTYDTLNAGWDDAAIDASTKPLATFVAAKTAYPALTKSWFSGKNASDLFSVTEWDKVWVGTSLSGNGHFILDFFSKNREAKVTGAGVEIETSRYTAVASYANRFWYAGVESAKNSGRVFFTKTVETSTDYERCYQTNDPTSEVISDLLDSDGGVINIPDAYGIKKLYAFGTSLIVFAENGLWQIKGVDGIFKATEFSVSKISNFGIVNANTFVDANGFPFWWSRIGIHSVSSDQVSGNLSETNLSKETIQTYWDNITEAKRLQAKGEYDQENQKIVWMFPSNTETIDYKYNRLLILDIPHSAWAPWEISDQTSNTNYIVGMSYFQSVGSVDDTQDVTINGATVTINGEAVTWDGGVTLSTKDNQIKFIVRDGVTGNLTIAFFGDNDFSDWGDTNYSSFIELGYNFFEQLGVRKHPLYITTYFERTESGWTNNGDGTYNLVNPSNCTLDVYWDFRDISSSNQTVYRLLRLPVVDAGDLSSFPYGQSVIINRTKIKGRGRVVNLKFSSTANKDFRFMGYSMMVDQHANL